MFITSPYFVNVSIIFFLFLSNSGPRIYFTTEGPSSQYNLTYSLCKTPQNFVKMNEPTNSQTSFSNFFGHGLLSLNNNILLACSLSLKSVRVFAKWKTSLKSLIDYKGLKLSISNIANLYWSFFGIPLYHSITDAQFFHWFTLTKEFILVLILSIMALLIFKMSDFDGFINLNYILFGKFSLWYLMVMYYLFSYIFSM